MKNWQWMKQVFLLSPLFKEGEGGNLFEIMAGGEALIQGRGLFQGYTVFTFSKILLHVIYLFLQTSTMIVNFYRFEDTFTVEGNRHFCFEFIIISPCCHVKQNILLTL